MTRKSVPTRRAALGLIGASFVLPRAALAGAVETLAGTAFGTRWRVVATQGSGVVRMRPEIEALFSKIDMQFSPWRRDSDISRFNANHSGLQLAEPELIEVTEAALNIARRSEGAFDPTVGPLVARWGFGPIHGGGPPDWRGIAVGPDGLTKSRSDLTLDLCGIAKGWALDEAARLMSTSGLGSFLFEIGGEIIARGHHPNGRDWRVAVDAPMEGLLSPATLRLPDGVAVATSGVRAQSYVFNDHRYGHIIEPRTGVPVTDQLRSVTVVADDAMSADAWATALFAAGDLAGPDLAPSEDIGALFLIEDDEFIRQLRTGFVSELVL